MRLIYLLIGPLLTLSFPMYAAEIEPKLSAIYSNSDGAEKNRQTLKELHQMYLELFRAFSASYGEVTDASESPCNFEPAHFARWQEAFERDFQSKQPSERLLALRDLATKKGYNLKIFSPKIWQHLFQEMIHSNHLFSIILDDHGTIQDFCAQMGLLSLDAPGFFGIWLEDLALFISQDTTIDLENFLSYARKNVFFAALELTQKKITAYEYLARCLPVYYLDDKFPDLTIAPSPSKLAERLQAQKILYRIRLLNDNAGAYSYNHLTPAQHQVLLNALSRAGIKANLSQYTSEHFTGVVYPQGIWRILEGGFSTPEEREQLLGCFRSKKYEMEAYLKYRAHSSVEDLNSSETIRLIHWEILAAVGQQSAKLIEDKVRKYSGPNVELDLAIVEQIKDGTIWDAIAQKRQELKDIILFVKPPAVKKQQPEPSAPKVEKKPRSRTKKPAQKSPQTSTPSNNPTVTGPVTPEEVPTVEEKPASGKKKRKRNRLKRLKRALFGSSPVKIPEGEGYKLTPPDIRSERELIEEELKKQRINQENAAALGALNQALVPRGTQPSRRHRVSSWGIPRPVSLFKKVKNAFAPKGFSLGEYFPQDWKAAFMQTAQKIYEQKAREEEVMGQERRYVGAAEELQLKFLKEEFEAHTEALHKFAPMVDGPHFDHLMIEFNRLSSDALEIASTWKQWSEEDNAPLAHLHSLFAMWHQYLNEVWQIKEYKDLLIARVQTAEENMTALKAMLANPDEKYSYDEIYQAYSVMPLPNNEDYIGDQGRAFFLVAQLRAIVADLYAWNQTMSKLLFSNDSHREKSE